MQQHLNLVCVGLSQVLHICLMHPLHAIALLLQCLDLFGGLQERNQFLVHGVGIGLPFQQHDVVRQNVVRSCRKHTLEVNASTLQFANVFRALQ